MRNALTAAATFLWLMAGERAECAGALPGIGTTWGSDSSDVAVPAVSGWGAILLVVLLLAAWWVFGRKRGPSPPRDEGNPDP